MNTALSARWSMLQAGMGRIPFISATGGYASYNNFVHVIENGQYFLIRCNDTRAGRILGKSMDGIKEMDVHADRILTRSHSRKKMSRPELEDNYRFVCDSVDMDYLSQKDTGYDIGDFKDLYHLRWNEENAFRDIKYPLCLKAFHSKKYEYTVQEVWVRAIPPGQFLH